MSRYTNIQPIGFLDNAMYKPPAELMAQVIQTKDAHADEFFGSLQALQDEVEVDPHSADVEAAREQEKKITGIIDETTQMGMGDVANLYKYQGSLKKAQRKIGDIIDKEITPINEYNKAIKEEKKARFKEYDENPKKYSHFNSKEELGAWIDSQYKGYRDEEGALTKTPQVSLRGKGENLDIVKDFLQGHTGMNYSESRNYPTGGYSKAWQGLKAGDIDDAVNNYLNQNEEIEAHLRQRAEVNSFRGNDLDYQAERIKLKNELIDTANANFGRRLVQDSVTVKAPTDTDGGGGDGDDDRDLSNSTSTVVTKESNPYYDPKAAEKATNDPEGSVKDFKTKIYKESQALTYEALNLTEGIKNAVEDNLGFSNLSIDPLTFKMYGTADGTTQEVNPELIFSQYDSGEMQSKYDQYQQKIEDFESMNLLADSVDVNNIQKILSTPQYKINNSFSENPSNIFGTKVVKDIDRDLSSNFEGKKASNMEASISHLEDTPLGAKKDTRLIFLKKGENSGQAEKRARDAYGPNTTLIILDENRDMYSKGYVDMSYIRKFLTKVDKIKTVKKEGKGKQNLYIQSLIKDNPELESIFSEPANEYTSTVSETPDIDGYGNFQLNDDLTQDGAILGKQTVKIGGKTNDAYDIPIVFRADGTLDSQHITIYDQARQEAQSLSKLLEGLPERNIINSNSTTSLKIPEVQVGNFTIRVTADGDLLKDGKKVTNESTARELIMGYLKLKSQRSFN